MTEAQTSCFNYLLRCSSIMVHSSRSKHPSDGLHGGYGLYILGVRPEGRGAPAGVTALLCVR